MSTISHCYISFIRLQSHILPYNFFFFLFFFFHTTLFHHIYISFVTTRQRSTYKQSIVDYNERTLACIRTLETSYDNKTHNNAPKATGNGLIQCGTAITRSIFFNFSQQITHSSPVRAGNGVPIVSFKVWFIFCCCQCSAVCKFAINWTALLRRRTILQNQARYMTDNTRWHHT